MSDDLDTKTEDPTAKRQGEARNKGQVAKSRGIDHWAMLLASTLILFIFVPSMAASMKQALIIFLERPHAIPADLGNLRHLLVTVLVQVGILLAPPVALLIVAAVGSGMVQHGILFSPEALIPKLSKLSPLNGLKRIFTTQGLVEFAKGAVKMAVLGGFS